MSSGKTFAEGNYEAANIGESKSAIVGHKDQTGRLLQLIRKSFV